MTVKPIPEGYHSITPYLIVNGAAEAIEFYGKAFHATELLRLPGPGGNVMHAEMKIGDSIVMMADECPEMGAHAPQPDGKVAMTICLYVENVDEIVAQAIDAGATVVRPLQDQFYGDRSATLKDPYGHTWTVATHIEDVPEEEMNRRMEEMMKQQPPPE